MKIHALSTGTVRLKHAFLFARTGMRRQLSLFTPGPFSNPLPVHLWVVEHEGRRILVDTGETISVHDIPFAKFELDPGEELPGVLSDIGMQLDDIDTVVLTHMHGDHMDGAVHLTGMPILVHEQELAYSRSMMARVSQRVLRQPIPAGVRFEPFALDRGPFGGFPASRPLTDDGRVVAVATPGHTPGHVSVVCVDDQDRHVMLAGDTTDTLEQLLARRCDAVSPKPAVTLETIDRIRAHGVKHALVYLPSHDPDSASRLAAHTTL